MKKLWMAVLCYLATGVALTLPARAQEFANIEYLCCDWGPAMKLSAKTNEPPVFSETEEEVYFLKQVDRFTRTKAGDKGHGTSIYLCKMKPDGSEKTEIQELWRNVAYPIDTQANTSWMSVNAKTHRIALSIVAAGSDLIGLWTMGMDGGDLRRIISPTVTDGQLWIANNPSWTPDGRHIAMGWGSGGRIAQCDSNGSNIVYLTSGPGDSQPRVSPDGKTIAYCHLGDARTGGLYLMGIDGSNSHIMRDPQGKKHSGLYPAWSPDGGRIYAIGLGIVDAGDGRLILDREPLLQGRPSTCGWSHWGKLGFIGFNVGGIKCTDSELREAKWIGSSKLVNCSESKAGCNW